MQGELGETGNSTIWGDAPVYSRNWGGLEMGSLGMALSVIVVGGGESLAGVQGDRQGLEYSHRAAGRLSGNALPVRLELDPFPSSSCSLGRTQGFVWRGGKSFCGQLLPWF